MTTKPDDIEKPASKTPPRITVRANAAVLGLRAFETADVDHDTEVQALLANGILEKA